MCIMCYCRAEKDSVHSSRLRGTAMFKDARNDAEERIYSQINEKIDDFFDLGMNVDTSLLNCQIYCIIIYFSLE